MSFTQDYLAELHDEGQLKDSGSFTVDALQARTKIKNLQAQSPGLWLLKAVQSAVRLQSPNVTVKQGRDWISVEFAPRLEVEELLQLLRDFQQPDGDVAHTLGELYGSAYAALADAPQHLDIEFFLEQHGPQAYRIHEHGATRLEKSGSVPKGTLRLTRHAHRAGGLRHLLNYFATSRTANAEIDTLRSRARFCALPITIDGRQINDPTVEHAAGFPSQNFLLADVPAFARCEMWSILDERQPGAMALPDPAQRVRVPFILEGKMHGWQGLHWVCIREIGSDRRVFEGPPFDFAWAKGQVQGDYYYGPFPSYTSRMLVSDMAYIPDATFSGQRKPLCGKLHLTWSIGRQDRSVILPVHLGVQLEPMEIDLPVAGVIAVIASDRWNTDLSQLKVVRDEFFEGRVRALIPPLEQLRRQMIELLKVEKLSRKALVDEFYRTKALAILRETVLIED